MGALDVDAAADLVVLVCLLACGRAVPLTPLKLPGRPRDGKVRLADAESASQSSQVCCLTRRRRRDFRILSPQLLQLLGFLIVAQLPSSTSNLPEPLFAARPSGS